jgi:hypothetical protein
MKTKWKFAVCGACLLWPLSACAQRDLTAFEEDNASACFVDYGAWAGSERSTAYVENSYLELYEHFPVFLDDLDRAAARAVSRPEQFEELHIEAGSNIVRLGRLLPRLERGMDFPPMIGQMKSGSIWGPSADQRSQLLRIALAEEFVEFQMLREHMTAFLVAFEQTEGLLLSFKTDATRFDRQQLIAAAAALREGWEGVRPGMRSVIFDRPHMPVGESLSERLQARVTAICENYDECGDGENGCRGGATSDDGGSGNGGSGGNSLLDAPMDGGS